MHRADQQFPTTNAMAGTNLLYPIAEPVTVLSGIGCTSDHKAELAGGIVAARSSCDQGALVDRFGDWANRDVSPASGTAAP